MAFVAYGKQTLTTSGTPQQCIVPAITANPSAQQYAQQITFQAPTTNTSNVYVGDSTIVKSSGVGVAAILTPGQSMTIPCQNGILHPLNFWFDTDTNNNVVYASGSTR